MEDLASALQQILSNPDTVNQLRQAASALGLGGGTGPAGAAPVSPPPQGQAAPSSAAAGSGLDFSALASLLSAAQPPQSAPAQAPAQNAGLSSLLGGLLSGGQAAGGFGANPGAAGSLDLRALGALQKAFSTFNQSDPNIELLRALKGHFSPERAKKVDDAIRIMQLIKLLPLIKESGLLGGDPT